MKTVKLSAIKSKRFIQQITQDIKIQHEQETKLSKIVASQQQENDTESSDEGNEQTF